VPVNFIKYFALISCLALLNANPVFAQEIKLEGKFRKDTVQVGEPVEYEISIEHPLDINLILPDSLAQFPGLEIVHKGYEPTKSDSLVSTEKIWYTFTSFVPDTLITFALPVYWIREADSIAVFPAPDTLVISTILPKNKAVADTLQLTSDTDIMPVEPQFNYPYLLIGLAALAVFVIAIISIFGDRILLRWRAFVLQRRHRKFMREFNTQLEAVKLGQASAKLPYFLWKNYLENLEKEPYTKLTTAEISRIDKETQSWQPSLHALDMVLFDYEPSDQNTLLALTTLGQAAESRFRLKQDEILHA
jgi:hypothetical protein